MNSFDYKITTHLMHHARTTWAELGTLLGLSAPAAADRVHKLEEQGVISGYAALVNPEYAGCGLAAIILITLDNPADRPTFLELVKQSPEIMECHHIAGAEDYLLKVRCAGTRELEKLISQDIKALPGIKTRTTIILSTLKETPILPIKQPEER